MDRKYREIVNDYIRAHRDNARHEMDQFRKLPSLEDAIRHAALCHRLPRRTRHPHQCRIPAAVLQAAERRLQRISDVIRRTLNFTDLHRIIDREIGPIHGIGDLAVYDIAHRIGSSLGKPPILVYLHRGTRAGARRLGFKGKTLDPFLLPAEFLRLTPAEIEDCLCMYKDGFLPSGRTCFTPSSRSRCIVPQSRGRC